MPISPYALSGFTSGMANIFKEQRDEEREMRRLKFQAEEAARADARRREAERLSDLRRYGFMGKQLSSAERRAERGFGQKARELTETERRNLALEAIEMKRVKSGEDIARKQIETTRRGQDITRGIAAGKLSLEEERLDKEVKDRAFSRVLKKEELELMKKELEKKYDAEAVRASIERFKAETIKSSQENRLAFERDEAFIKKRRKDSETGLALNVEKIEKRITSVKDAQDVNDIREQMHGLALKNKRYFEENGENLPDFGIGMFFLELGLMSDKDATAKLDSVFRGISNKKLKIYLNTMKRMDPDRLARYAKERRDEEYRRKTSLWTKTKEALGDIGGSAVDVGGNVMDKFMRRMSTYEDFLNRPQQPNINQKALPPPIYNDPVQKDDRFFNEYIRSKAF
jgi:hypothetical protein